MYQLRKHHGHTWHTKSGELIFWNSRKNRAEEELSMIAENWFSIGATIEASSEILFVTAKNGRELTYRIIRKGC